MLLSKASCCFGFGSTCLIPVYVVCSSDTVPIAEDGVESTEVAMRSVVCVLC